MSLTLPKFDTLVVSCEHASNKLPVNYQHLLGCPEQILRSHCASDIGAEPIARYIGKHFSAPYYYGKYSRLLIDLNRSLHHPDLFSRYSSVLTKHQKQDLIDKFYVPYRSGVEACIKNLVLEKATVLHLSFHSFTPVLRGEKRKCDIGLLYDPKRPLEKSIATSMRHSLSQRLPGYVIRRNFPYRGTADGFTVYLRKQFTEACYAGIEVEINQRRVQNTGRIQQALETSIREATDHPLPNPRGTGVKN